MAIQKKSDQLSYDARSNFGLKGWWIIIFSFMNWYFYGGLCNSSLNTVVPMQAKALGVESGSLLSWSTPAGLIALVVCLAFGRVVAKTGVKKTLIIILVLSALSVVWWASAASVASYIFSLVVMVCMMNAIQLVGGNMVITNWFPKKKGIAIGWATMGLNISSATFVTILVALTASLGGVKYALYVMAGCLIVLMLITIFFYKDYPEQWNFSPDNNPNEIRKSGEKLRTGWTSTKVLRTRSAWAMGMANGIYAMVTVGFVSTLIPCMLMKGYALPQALTMMTVASLFGCIGSYACGFIDQKFGAQKSAILYGIWVMVGIVFYFIPGNAATWIFLFMLGSSLGGSNNYPPSMTAQMFGRDGAIIAFPIIFAITGIIRSCCYVVQGQSLVITHTYDLGWKVFFVAALVATIMYFFINLNPKKDPMETDGVK